MPYKDPLRKTEWERQHRADRLARRRELRRTHAANEVTAAQPVTATTSSIKSDFTWLFLIAGGTIAFIDPQLAIGMSGLTLILAAFYKASGAWWIAGIFTLALALLLRSAPQNLYE